MKYAVLKFSGQQHKVSEGDEIYLQGAKDQKKLDFKEVLLLVDEDKVVIGTPTVSGAMVTAEVVEVKKGKKIQVKTYKAKSRYRKTKGFRPIFTKVKIIKILSPAS